MKKTILTFYIYLFTCFLLTGQDLIEGVLWVTSANESAKPLPGQVITTNNHINLLLNDYGIFSFEPAFPGSKNDLLKNTYEIRFTGNTTALFSDLMVNFKDDYSFVEMHYSEPDIAVYDPEDYMWFLTLQNPDSWLWHLLKIQANDAWDITIGDPNIVIAIIDTDVDAEHPDLMTELKLPYEPYTGYVFTCNPFHGHGTAVSSFATAETTEIGGTPNGQLASVGFNTKFIFYHAWGIGSAIYLQKAHHASLVMGADVITSSAGGWRCQGGPNPIEEAAVKEILDNGTVIVMPAGNGINGTHCDNGNNGIHDPWYPLHPIYDERIIIVTGTDKNDYHYYLNPQGVEKTHSHYPAVDISSPGHELMGAKPTECGSVTWPYYGGSGGTSFATPIVAGVCGLLKSIDKNFTPGEIQEFIKRSADPVVDEQNYPGLLGAGRINAFGAVNLAVNCTPEVITGNEVWSEDRIVLCGLEIESGATLTIYSTVKLSRNSSIIVKPGGNLIIDNGLLTSLDNKFWQGIEVWGNSTKSQLINPNNNIQYQGKIVLKEAVIENAKTGVLLGKPGSSSFNGGIIVANDVIFKNNAKAVHFLPYNNFNPITLKPLDNISYFKYCKFEITNEYIPDYTFYKHADLSRVKGIDFIACDFSVIQTPGVSTWNQAIASYSAGFNVKAICNSNTVPCNSYDKCTFDGFQWGIFANNDHSTSNTFFVNRAVFTNNSYGIRMKDIHRAAILSSEFSLVYNAPELEPCELIGKSASAYGIHMTGCNGFAVEENEFYKASGAPTGYYTGIYIAETQAADQVYKNTFEGLSYGNYAVGKNWKDTYTWQGLAYYCNENTNNWQDFTVEDVPLKPDGIQHPQGSPQMPAGNTFSANANNNFNNWDFNNWIGYYYYAPTQGNTNTVYYPQVVNRVIREEVVGIQNPCLSNYGGGGSGSGRDVVMTPAQKQQAEMEYAVNLSNYNNVKTLHDNLKDGGSTTATLADITTAWPSDMWALRAELLGKSPHLSMEVLKAAADKTNVLPESIIFEIMAANPDELKKEELIKYLEDKDNPLPEYMIDFLRQVAMGSSYKTVLLRQMAHYGQLKTLAANNIIRSLLNDTITDNVELRNWLNNIGGKRADEQIIASYMGEGNYTNALALANMMPALYNYTGDELTEHGYYLDMLNLQISLAQQGKTIFDLDSTEINNLVFMAENSSGTAGSQAKGILEYAYGYHYCNCISADTSGYKSSKVINPDAFEKLLDIEITVKPNPAKDWAVFNYSLPDSGAEGVIKISDVSGKLITALPINGKQGQKIWDTREIKSAVYFYTLHVSGFKKSGKIVVSK
jgi:subtilisin family serine protease